MHQLSKTSATQTVHLQPTASAFGRGDGHEGLRKKAHNEQGRRHVITGMMLQMVHARVESEATNQTGRCRSVCLRLVLCPDTCIHSQPATSSPYFFLFAWEGFPSFLRPWSNHVNIPNGPALDGSQLYSSSQAPTHRYAPHQQQPLIALLCMRGFSNWTPARTEDDLMRCLVIWLPLPALSPKLETPLCDRILFGEH